MEASRILGHGLQSVEAWLGELLAQEDPFFLQSWGHIKAWFAEC